MTLNRQVCLADMSILTLVKMDTGTAFNCLNLIGTIYVLSIYLFFDTYKPLVDTYKLGRHL